MENNMVRPDYPNCKFIDALNVTGPRGEIEKYVAYARDYYYGYNPWFDLTDLSDDKVRLKITLTQESCD